MGCEASFLFQYQRAAQYFRSKPKTKLSYFERSISRYSTPSVCCPERYYGYFKTPPDTITLISGREYNAAEKRSYCIDRGEDRKEMATSTCTVKKQTIHVVA